MSRLKLVHRRAIQSVEYQEVLADQLAGLSGPDPSRLTVVHDASGACCSEEPWPATLQRLLVRAAQRRGTRAAVLVPGFAALEPERTPGMELGGRAPHPAGRPGALRPHGTPNPDTRP